MKDESKKKKHWIRIKKDGSDNGFINTLLYIGIGVAMLMIVLLGIDIYNAMRLDIKKVDYQVYLEQLENHEINIVYLDETDMRWVTFEDSENYIEEIRKEKEAEGIELSDIPSSEERISGGREVTHIYETNYPYYEEFRKDALEAGALIEYRSFDSLCFTFLKLLLAIAPTAILLTVMIFMLNNVMMAGKSKAKTAEATKDNVKFEDIIGLAESIEDIKFTLKVIENSKLRKKHNLKQPKGLLLSGPPGTGKTMIAKAISNELNIKMISVDSSSIIQMYVGLGAARIREIFKEAKKNKPCIIFFDEIDAIGGQRGTKHNSAEHDQTLNALLQELDGFDSDSGIFVIAATNMESNLDKALIRPGRFDKKIIINPPKDWKTRAEMFKHYLKDEDTSKINIDSVAKQCSGLTGADIAQIVNEAKMIAVANDNDDVTTEILEEAIDKVWFKGSKTKTTYKKDAEITAYHESGHALSSLLNNMPIARISIIPNTSGVGGMVVSSDGDTSFITKNDLVNKIKMAYSGRIAEELVYGSSYITSGARSDIQVATNMIRAYIEEYGFDEEFGLVNMASIVQAGYLLEEKVTNRISEIAKELYKEAYKELEGNIDILHRLAEKVLVEETINGDDITTYYNTLLKEMRAAN